MPRLMSFSLTTEQVRARTKTVTRRTGWARLRAGDRLVAVEKAMGLKKGETVVRLGEIVVVDARWEPLQTLLDDPIYGLDEVLAEGFPDTTLRDFVAFFCRTHRGVTLDTPVRRIQFDYL